MKITEIKGNPQTLNLTKGTLRLLPRESKEISDGLVSDEMKIAETMGLIQMTPSPQKEVESKNNNKSGGAK